MSPGWAHPARLALAAALVILGSIGAGAQDAGTAIPVPLDTLQSDSAPLVLPLPDTVPFVVVQPASAQREWIEMLHPNGEEEQYLRYLQAAGAVPTYPWTVRGFSRRQARTLAAEVGTHPWSGSWRFTRERRVVAAVPLSLSARGNSAFPYGHGDGAVWAGRGFTAWASGGFSAGLGPLSVTFAPMAFVAQNAEFELMDNGLSGDRRFADPLYPAFVDRPQRFGESAYSRVDPGQSEIRLDLGPAALGFSTGNVAWGPGNRYPFLLGTNAGGFAHGYVATARPLNLWLMRLHGQVLWGRLEQSDYSPVTGPETAPTVDDPSTRRFGAGLAFSASPRGVPNLELGFSRFFHAGWPTEGISGSFLRMPFETVRKTTFAPPVAGGPGEEGGGANQLAAVFARWVFPRAGLEVHAEYGRDDHANDRRDLAQEPDHARSYGFGIRHARLRGGSGMDGFRLEVINFQLPHLQRNQRGGGGIYLHSVMQQGHTHRGQLLGADVAAGEGAGATFAWDRYSPAGRSTVALHRVVRQETSAFYLGAPAAPASANVQYALELERLRTLRIVELTAGLTLLREFNRNGTDDPWGASAYARLRVPLLAH